MHGGFKLPLASVKYQRSIYIDVISNKQSNFSS